MSKLFRHVVSSAILIVFLFLAFGSDSSNKKKEITDSLSVEFEQVGYFKQNKQRVFTFFIKSNEKIAPENVPDNLWKEIEKHGLNQMHTEGKNTQSFYYLDRQTSPDVTQYKSYGGAIDKAYNKMPLAVVYIQFTGEKGIIKNPER